MEKENYETWKVVRHDQGFAVIDKAGETVSNSPDIQLAIQRASEIAKYRKLDGVVFVGGAQVDSRPFKLMPPPADRCAVCATHHDANAAHNQMSLYYQYRFYGAHGRWPTWADAVAHLPQRIQDRWRECLMRTNMWSEPSDGQPIADPPGESIHQVIEIPARTEVFELLQLKQE